MKIGLIGFGVGGSVFHAPLIRRTPGLELAAIVTSRPVPFDGVEVLSSVERLLTDASIPVVVVTTPTGTHFDIVRAALDAGKHVVVDKPITTNVAHADDLIALAERRRLLLTCYQNRRWDGDFLTVKSLLADGALGRLAHYEAHYDRFRTQLRDVWREWPAEGSGILLDLGSHLIDQCIHLFGRPGAVTGDVRIQRDGARAVDYFHLVLDYGFLRAVLHATMLAPHPGPHFTLHGDCGTFLKFGMDPQEDALRAGRMPGDPGWGEESPELWGELFPVGGEPRRIPTIVGGYERFYSGLVDALEHGGPPPVDPRESRDGLAVIEAALRSAAERGTIDL